MLHPRLHSTLQWRLHSTLGWTLHWTLYWRAYGVAALSVVRIAFSRERGAVSRAPPLG
jgi:hypothetical protein